MINTSSNLGEYRKKVNQLEEDINTTNTNLESTTASLSSRLTSVEGTVPVSRGGTGATTNVSARKNLGITRDANCSYNILGAAYYGSNNSNSYVRITLPTTASTWMMLYMKISLRTYSPGLAGEIMFHGYWSSGSDWNTLTATVLGNLSTKVSVYASDKKYIYIKMPSTTYFTCSVDKMLVGDNAVGYDYSNIIIDTVASLPATYQTVTMQNTISIVSSYTSGTTWYRVWSDGWIEQGGKYTGTSGTCWSATITFPKAFSNTNYNVSVTSTGLAGDMWGEHGENVESITTSSFKYYFYTGASGDGTTGFYWTACGY